MNKDVPKAKHVPGLYINNDYNTNTNDNSEIEDNEYEDKNGPDDKDDQLIYSSEEKMMISITGNSESVFSNKLRIEVNARNDNPPGGQSGAGGGGVAAGKLSNSQQKVWTNFAGSNLTNFAGKFSARDEMLQLFSQSWISIIISKMRTRRNNILYFQILPPQECPW